MAVTVGARAYAEDGWIAPNLDAEWSRRAGDLSLEGAAHYGWNGSPTAATVC